MKRAFSLIELLVICGIITTLLVVMVPTLTGVREDAIDVACKSNLRQLAQIAWVYAQEVDHFPWGGINPMTHDKEYAKTYGENNEEMVYPWERPSLYDCSAWKEWDTFCWDFKKKKGEPNWECGIMFGPHVGCSRLLCCPKCANSSDNWDGNSLTGYNYNVAYLGYVEGDAGLRRYPLRANRIKHPDRVVMFGDGGYSGGVNKFMRATKQDKNYDGSSSSLRKAGTQAFRHGYGSKRHCNMAFVDGHVESFRNPYKSSGKPGWVDEKTHSAFISSGNGIYGPRGWGEEDDFTE